MVLPHRRRQPRLPGAIELTEAAVTIAIRANGTMLLPQQLQRHPWSAQLAVHRRPVRLRPAILGRHRWRRVEPELQRLVGQAFRQRPGQAARRARPMQSRAAVALTPRLAAIVRLDMPAADSLSTSRILRIGNLGPGMPRSLWKGEKPCRFADHSTASVTPVHSWVAIARNGWSRSIGTGGRNQSEQLVAITRCAHLRSDYDS